MSVVEVWGEHYEVSVSQRKKTVWVANGTYHGVSITGKGSSANSALESWRETARYRGNNGVGSGANDSVESRSAQQKQKPPEGGL
jgi:hypothetical protein